VPGAERPDDHPADVHARRADAAAHRPRPAVQLAHAGAGAGADAALGHRAAGRDARRLPAHLPRRPGATVADVEVEEERAGHVRHDAGSGRVPAALGLEPAHHAPDRLPAEPAAAAEHDTVDGADEVTGVQVVEADDVVGAAAQLDAGHGGCVAEHDGDAGEADGVGRVADADPRDLGDHAAPGFRLTSAAGIRPSAT